VHRLRIPFWVGYIGAGLLMAHALLSFYWAAGGMIGMSLLSDGIHEMAADRETWFISLIWTVALLKSALALILLGLTRGWEFPLLPGWMPLLAAWAAGILLSLYAVAQLASLTIGGLIMRPDDGLPTAYWAYLLLWAPLWLAIGVSATLTAWRSTVLYRTEGTT
jgi:hypothetical protein